MDFSYPIGRPSIPETIDMETIEAWINEAAVAPEALRHAVMGLTGEQLDTPYREDGWTLRQVVHHLHDTHLHTYTNFKLALVEDTPIVKPIPINTWAELPDSREGDVDTGVAFFDAVQRQWVAVMRHMTRADFDRTFQSPGREPRTLAASLGVYAWHGQHHVAQITSLRDRMGW